MKHLDFLILLLESRWSKLYWRPRLSTCSITSALTEGSDRDTTPETSLVAWR